MCRNDGGYVEWARIGAVQRASLFTAGELPSEIEIFLRLFVGPSPQVDQTGPDVQPRQQYSLIERLRGSDGSLAKCERGVPFADSHSVLHRKLGRPQRQQWRLHRFGKSIALRNVVRDPWRIA